MNTTEKAILKIIVRQFADLKKDVYRELSKLETMLDDIIKESEGGR